MSEVEDQTGGKAVELIKVAENEKAEPFLDQHGAAFVRIPPGRVLGLKSREFRTWLTKKFYESKNRKELVGSEGLNAALGLLEAEAFEKKRVELETRIGRDGNDILIDLADESQEAIRICATGWDRVALDRAKFRRYSHMLPMTLSAEKGPSLGDFLRRFRLKNPEDEVLLVGWIGAAFICDIPHAILFLVGPEGSTKTSSSSSLMRLIDPSSIREGMTLSRKQDALIQQLSHHYVPLFDNCGEIQDWQSDELCRAVTGAGSPKRTLYTDEDDTIQSYRRPIIMNGLNIPTQNGDFIDRIVIIELQRVPERERLEESEVRGYVEAAIPILRVMVFDGLSNALRIIEQVRKEYKEKPRMADFFVWGEAFCRGMGYESDRFTNRYRAKVEESVNVALENNVVAELLFAMFEDLELVKKEKNELTQEECLSWEGTTTELLHILEQVNAKKNMFNPNELTHSPEKLSRQLGKLDANLSARGVHFVREPRGGKRRPVRLWKGIPNSVTIVTPSQTNDASDSSDGSLRTSREAEE